MSNDDPWAVATPEPEPEETVATVTQLPTAKAPEPVQVPGGDSHVLSFKGGTGYDAFLYVLKADSNKAILSQLADPDFQEVLKRAQSIQKWNTEQFTGAPKSDGNSAPKAQPNRTEAPGGEKRFCKHGEMKYREDISKAGNPYKGFFCTERNRDEQCKAVFLK